MKKMFRIVSCILVLSIVLHIGANAITIDDLYDVHTNHWAYSSINYVISKGYMGETNDHYFEPDATASRAMIVTTVYRMAGEPPINVTEAPFADVTLNTWYTKPIAWAKSIGIIEGYEDGYFRPNMAMPREQIALIMYRYADYLNLDLSVAGANVGEFPDFYDTPLGCQIAMKWSIKKGMFIGRDGYLYPNVAATRAELATCLHRFEVNDSPVTSISIRITSKTVSTTWAGYIPVTVYPHNAGNKAVFWASSNPTVASVDQDSGWVSAKQVGTTMITAITADGNFTVSCQLIVTPQVYNMQLYQYKNPPEKDSHGNNAGDMAVNDKSLSELRDMSAVLGGLADMYDHPPDSIITLHSGPVVVFNKMRQLAHFLAITDASMNDVALDMIDHFIEGSKDDYQNAVLTQKVLGHSSTQEFMNEAKTIFINSLKSNDGVLSAVSADQEFLAAMESRTPPSFEETEDYFNGLLLTIHHMWGYTIEISNYQFDGTTFSGTINYIFYDHFGLDDNDVSNSQWYLAYTEQFGAWYVLQHYQGCAGQHKPFVSYMRISSDFSGTIA